MNQIQLFFQIAKAQGIARRYFVVNGFDGALTMLGIVVGFYFSEGASVDVAFSACIGAAVALGMSGVTSAYISERAEREKELRELEQAMVKKLGDSAHGKVVRFIPLIIGVINGLSRYERGHLHTICLPKSSQIQVFISIASIFNLHDGHDDDA